MYIIKRFLHSVADIAVQTVLFVGAAVLVAYAFVELFK